MLPTITNQFGRTKSRKSCGIPGLFTSYTVRKSVFCQPFPARRASKISFVTRSPSATERPTISCESARDERTKTEWQEKAGAHRRSWVFLTVMAWMIVIARIRHYHAAGRHCPVLGLRTPARHAQVEEGMSAPTRNGAACPQRRPRKRWSS